METVTFSGTVRRVFFCNPESPFMSGVLALDDAGAKAAARRELRFAGKVAAAVGDKLEVTGVWTVHPKFGEQVDVSTGVVRMDESPEALTHLLATDKRFAGLGPVLARRVVNAALALSDDGEIASALLKYHEQIATRAKVALDVVENAGKVWSERRGYFDALATLCGQGWSNAQAQSIIAKYGENAPTIVKGDPYALIGRIHRFGFRTVDVVARKMGVSSVDPMRLAAGLAYCLDQMGSQGDTRTTRPALIDAALQELRPDTMDGEDRVRQVLDEMIRAGLVWSEVVNGTEVVADLRLATAEFEVFEWLLEAMDEPNDDLETGRLSFEGPRTKAILPTLNRGQAAAVYGIWSRYAMVITGGAGVGKTYTMRSICEIAEENGLTVALCAPTGKAARKLAHATSRRASTIHRLLEPAFDEETGGFKFVRNAGNQVEADLVVVDEVSMVDVRLMLSLLRALPSEARLLLVGDHNQIPSVSAGAILRDLLSARASYPGAVHVLTDIVRQAGILATNTTAILGGLVPPSAGPAWGVTTTEKGHESAAAAIVAELVESVVTAPEPLEPFGRVLDLAWDVQVLAPMKKGPLGTYALNVQLQRVRQRLLGNPPPEPTAKDDRPKPLIGDRIIWTRNDYELDLFNGTQGVVLSTAKGGAMELFLEDGREVQIPGEKRAHVEVAYAMTIHKAQGSEWPYVVLIASSSHYIMHDRNLLYTGASRAAESLTIVGDHEGVRHFAKERKSARRQTFGEILVTGWRPSSTRGLAAQPVALDEVM